MQKDNNSSFVFIMAAEQGHATTPLGTTGGGEPPSMNVVEGQNTPSQQREEQQHDASMVTGVGGSPPAKRISKRTADGSPVVGEPNMGEASDAMSLAELALVVRKWQFDGAADKRWKL